MIDITTCIGCRKGVWPLIYKDNKYYHVDLFSSAESGAQYECLNSDEIGEYLVKIEGKGTLKPNPELDEVYTAQEFWWEDILTLCHEVFKDPNDIADLFNSKINSKSLITSENIDIENALIKLAKDKYIEITQQKYPDLLLWKN
jgi:hypothetical protein